MSILSKTPQFGYSKELGDWVEVDGSSCATQEFDIIQLNVLFDKRKKWVYFPHICHHQIRYKHIIEDLFFGEATKRAQEGKEFRDMVICCNEVTTRFIDMLKENEFCRTHFFISNIKGFGEQFGNIIISSFPFQELYTFDISKSCGLWRPGIVGIMSSKENDEEEEEGEEEDQEIDPPGIRRVFAILNIHTSAKSNGTLRGKQLDEMYRLFEEDERLNECENVLICGDLNFMSASEDKNIHSGYVDVWKELYGDTKPGYTFDSTVNLMHREIWPLGRVVGYNTRKIQWRLDRMLLKNRSNVLLEEEEDKVGKYSCSVTISDLELFANKPVLSKERNRKQKKKKKIVKSGSGNSFFRDLVETVTDYYFEKSVFRSGDVQDYLFPSDHFGLKGKVKFSLINML